MKVVCVNADECRGKLTVGSIYEAEEDGVGFYKLQLGEEYNFLQSRFVEVEPVKQPAHDPNIVNIEMTVKEAIVLSHLVGRVLPRSMSRLVDSLWHVLKDYNPKHYDCHNNIELSQDYIELAHDITKKETEILKGENNDTM